MVENNQLDEHTINMLVIIFKRAMDKITATIKENKMVESIQAMDNFNKQKEKQAKQDAKTLKDLDSKLKNL
jgi:fructose-1,6-bisphosphatase